MEDSTQQDILGESKPYEWMQTEAPTPSSDTVDVALPAPVDTVSNKSRHTAKRVKKKKKSKRNLWPIFVFFAAFVLSVVFSLSSELVLTNPSLIVALVLIFVFLVISIFFDIIGVAVTKCEDKAFFAMASRKVRGAKKSLFLIKHADRVNSVCCDIIGEVLSILSGALGMVVVGFLIAGAEGIRDIIVPVLVGASIASLTAGGKAYTKTIAIKKAQPIVFFAGKLLAIFGEGKGKKKRK